MTKTRIASILIIFMAFTSCNQTNKSESDSINNIEPTSKPTTDTLQAKNTLAYKNVYGIDVAKYQGDELSYLNKNKDSLTFIICKATEGETYTDPDFKNNWNLISEKGFVRGAYHFYHSSDSPEAQAGQYLSAIGTLSKNDLPPIVDFEEMSISKDDINAKVQKDLLAFLQILQQKTGRTPILYTDLNFASTQLTNSAFASYPLWIADYDNESAPQVPKLWNAKWTFWQKTDNYKTPEDPSETNDFDVFNGSGKEFMEFLEGK